MSRKASALGALVAVAAVALAGCTAPSGDGGDGGGNGDLIPVTLTLPAPASLESVVYDCVPKMEGFFEDEGLDVTVEVAEGSVLALQSLESGASDVVVVGTSPLMAGISNGQQVKAFATVVTGSY